MRIVPILGTNTPFFVDSVFDNVGLIVGIERIVTTVVTVRVDLPLDRTDSPTRLKVSVRFPIRIQVDFTGWARLGDSRISTTKGLPCRF